MGLVASILASPVGYLDFSLALLPVFLTRRQWGVLLTVAAVLLLVPHQMVWGWSLGSAFDMALAGSVYFAAYVLVLATVLAEATAEVCKADCGPGPGTVPLPANGSIGS